MANSREAIELLIALFTEAKNRTPDFMNDKEYQDLINELGTVKGLPSLATGKNDDFELDINQQAGHWISEIINKQIKDPIRGERLTRALWKDDWKKHFDKLQSPVNPFLYLRLELRKLGSNL
jgi:hypothetical protein